jgi:hypothetical protein
MLAFVAAIFALRWFVFGGGRRHLGVAVMLVAALLFAITAIAALGSNSAAPAMLVTGAVVSVLLGWVGYMLPRWMPYEPSADPILAAFANPTPTARPLGPQDVLGQWRYYVDPVGCAVTVDLQTDGRYRQVIADISGKPIDGPGGEWTLDGPNLNLDAFRSATRAQTSRVCWFFGDCQGDLILFVKDDPQAETMLVAIRAEKVLCTAASASTANKPTRKANSRSPSLFASDGRGHQGR